MSTPLLLLDLDGTLTDSYPGIASSLVHAYRVAGLPAPSSEQLRRFVGPRIHDSLRAQGVPDDRIQEVATAYRAAMEAGGLLENSVYPGIPAALRSLRTAGVRLAVATMKPEPFAERVCAHYGLDAYLDEIHGATLDESRSSKAEVIGAALDSLAVHPRDALMVGDREHDVHGARAHGIDCVGVAWGYAAPGELETAGALEIVGTPGELVTVALARLGVRWQGRSA